MLWNGFPDSYSTPSTVDTTFGGVRAFATRAGCDGSTAGS